ncbi:MAG: protein kinase [Planctomycetota bacterium]
MIEPSGDVNLDLQAFEIAWESGVVDDFSSSIPKKAQSDTELLTDLACIDLQNRIQRDIDTRVENYTTKFPQLAQDELVVLELIRTEFTFHPDQGSLDAELYCQRFPHLAHQIKMMFQLEFTGSRAVHVRSSPATWRCFSCDAEIDGREDGKTVCEQCGQAVRIGRYELSERVGQGAFGYVYRARDPKLDRDVAIKIPRSTQFLTPEESERFLRESRNAAQLEHAGIVRIFDTGRHQGIPYIVSEFVEGQPLSTLISEMDFDFLDAAFVVSEIANAIAHAHSRGTIHRDIKPSNIMTSNDPTDLQPRVMDFGLARRDQSDVSVTIDGQAIGTPAYMSPEQARGDSNLVGTQSDVYGLGVILYELLCGELPFRGNVQMLIQQVIHDDPLPPSRFRNRIPRDLETVCMKAINREPAGRYAGMQEFGDDLRRWIAGEPVHARRIGVVGKTWKWCCRRPAVSTLILALAIAVMAGVAGITWQWREAEMARNASESDLRDALESVDRVLGHLGSDALADVPQAKQLRADVLNDALGFFQRFRQRNPDDPRVAMQVANAHYQVARIQFALGKTTEAGKAFEAATAGYEKIKGRAPDRKTWQESAASAHSGYASFLLSQSKREMAVARQRKCLALRKQMHEENPNVGKLASKFATARGDLGRTLIKVDEVKAQYDPAIKQLEALTKKHKAIGYKHDLARVLNNYSIFLSEIGQNGESEKYRQRAVELLEKVVADDPNDEKKRANFANCCLQLVKHLRKESRLEAALKYQQKAVDAYRKLTGDFPATPRHRDRFAQVLNEVGAFAGTQKRKQDELKAYQEAVQQREILVALFPGNNGYQRSLVADLDELATTLVAQDRKQDAEVRLRERLILLRRLADQGAVADKIRLAIGLRDLRSLLSKSKVKSKLEESKLLRTESEERVKEFSVDQILQLDLSNREKLNALGALVSLAKRNDDLQRVDLLYRAKIKLYEADVAAKPDSLGPTSQLANHWFYLGEALYDSKRIKDSIEAFSKAIVFDERLLDRDPDSSIYASRLISHSSKLGHVLYFNGEPSEAVKVLQRSLDIAKTLFDERKNESFRSVRVLLAYLQLGDALAVEQLNFPAALAAYEEAFSMRDLLRDQRGFKLLEAKLLDSLAWFLLTCPDESMHDPERALELCQQAVEINPANASYIATHALALYQTGEYADAILRFQESSTKDEVLSPFNTLIAAMSQAKLKQAEKAKKLYDWAIQLNKAIPTEPGLFEQYRQKAEALIFD